ncbi:unnamed protein product [Mucor hiemalis]
MYENECDVFIAGSGVSGLYAAILLSKIGLSVHITDIDDRKKRSSSKKGLLHLSPRTLQLLKQLDLLTPVLEKGTRHWKFDLYGNKGYGNQAVTVEEQSIRLWENDTAEFNFSITIEKSIVHELLKKYLSEELGVQINYKQELLNIEESKRVPCNPTKVIVANDLALYYQYRPLPTLPMNLGEHQLERSVKSIHLKDVDTEQVKVWKSQAIIGADGQTSFVRQKLGISMKSYPLQSDTTRIFYTLQINIISTNFPGVRQVSTISKNKDILYIIGHQTKLYITFEHKPSWSKLSVDDEIPVNLAKRHIKSVMEPYQIEFGKVKSYHRWQGNNTSSCEEYNFESSFFFVGSAAQCMNPPGLFDINTNFEQVQNLCWKLALSLQHSASPKLLETFDQETRLKTDEAMQASTVFKDLIGDYYQHLEETNNVNPSHTRDLIYQLRRFKNCLVGTTPYSANILNNEHNHDDLLHLLRDDSNNGSIIDFNSSTPSFEFVGPPATSSGNSSSMSNTYIPLNLAVAGNLAPNAKLKPYTLFQLLLTSANPASVKPPLTTTLSSQQLLPSTTNNEEEEQPVTKKKSSTPPQTNSSLKDHRSERQRSNSVTTSNSSPNSGSNNSIWSVIPKLQKANSSKSKTTSLSFIKRSSISDAIKISTSASLNTYIATTPTSPSTTEPVITPASVLISAERWKSIRTNHIQLMDRIQSLNKSGCTFTILIFCGDMTEFQEKTRHFVKLLSLPTSFLQRYERAVTAHNNRSSIISITTADHRSSISSSTSSKQQFGQQNNTNGRKSSFDQPRRESFESAIDQSRFSMSTLSSSSTFHHPQQPLFSLLFVTSSARNDAVKYLNNTPPATVHSTFPCGLTQVLLDHDGQCYRAYNIKQNEVVVIRPDGYIGTRIPITQEEESFDRLNMYFDSFLRPPVDMNTAAAVVAAGYDC